MTLRTAHRDLNEVEKFSEVSMKEFSNDCILFFGVPWQSHGKATPGRHFKINQSYFARMGRP
jgi:hypothetical protein